MDNTKIVDKQRRSGTEETPPFVPDQDEMAITVDDFKGFLTTLIFLRDAG